MSEKECVICGKKTGMFSKKTAEGTICKECASMIPLSINLSSASTEFLKSVYESNLEKKNIFDTTASYEGVYIDSIHGLFCISKKGTREMPREFHDIYHITELEEVGIYCTNARNIGVNSNNIVCDIKMRVKTKDLFNDFMLVQNKKCAYKSVGNGKLEWKEPNELSMFRNMFNQMIDDVAFGLLKKLEKIQEFNQALSLEQRNLDWSKGALFVDDAHGFDLELLKSRRNLLMKIFHPDRNSEFADTEIAAMINEAYKRLSKEL